MVWDLVRDSAFGHCARYVSRGKHFRYAEEKDPSAWFKFVNQDNSTHGARRAISEPSDSADNVPLSILAPRTRGGIFIPENDLPSSSQSQLVDEANILDGGSGAIITPNRGKDRLVVDWLGPEDADNPRNWSTAKKMFITFQVCFLTFSVYIGSAIYSPGIPDVEHKFGVSNVAATLGLALYVAGYGTGPMIWSPMSDVPYIGRNPVYIVTLFIFVVLQIPTALAPNFGTLLAFRFLTGFFGSPALATGGASIIDMYVPRKQAYALSIWGISAVCGPIVGPLVGGFAAQSKGWTWTIWEIMWLSGFCLVFLFFFLPETSSLNILYRRTCRMRKLTGNQRLICEAEIMAEQMTARDIAMMTLVKPFTLNFTEPMIFLLNLYIALIYGLIYIWFESFPVVFVGMYGFNLGEQGLAFLGLLVAALITLACLFAWFRYQEKQFDESGNIQPEKRLIPAMIGAVFVPICLFWFGWTSRPSVHWIVPIIGSSFFSVAAFLLFQSVMPYLADTYPVDAASVFAGNDLFRSAFGTGFPLFAPAMYKNLGVAWASSTLAFLGIAFIPIPYLLYIYGKRLRMMSRHARKDS